MFIINTIKHNGELKMVIKNISRQVISDSNFVIGPNETLTVTENIGNVLLQKFGGSLQMLLDGNQQYSGKTMLNGSVEHFNYNLLNENQSIRG